MDKLEKITPTEKFKQDVISGLARYYREASSENIKRLMLRRIQAGYALQRPPIGYSKTKTSGLFKINRKGEALSQLMKKLANRDISIETFKVEVYFILSSGSRGFRTNTELKRLVSNPYYSGKVSWKGKTYNGLHRPLISETEQQKLIEML